MDNKSWRLRSELFGISTWKPYSTHNWSKLILWLQTLDNAKRVFSTGYSLNNHWVWINANVTQIQKFTKQTMVEKHTKYYCKSRKLDSKTLIERFSASMLRTTLYNSLEIVAFFIWQYIFYAPLNNNNCWRINKEIMQNSIKNRQPVTVLRQMTELRWYTSSTTPLSLSYNISSVQSNYIPKWQL